VNSITPLCLTYAFLFSLAKLSHFQPGRPCIMFCLNLRIGLSRSGFLRSGSLISFFALSLCANGQAPAYESASQSGTVPFESYHGGDIDSVNLATGELTLHVPLVSFPQLGGRLHADYSIVYTTPVVNEVSTNCGPHGSCTNLWEPPIVNSSAFVGGLEIVSDTIPALVFTNTDTGNCATPGACFSSAAVWREMALSTRWDF